MLNKEDKADALSELLNARMQHTRWIAEIARDEIPTVEPDPTRCQFGRWVSKARPQLEALDDFRRLDRLHQRLHLAYQAFKAAPEEHSRTEVQQFSRHLIDCIDQLEKRINAIK